MSITIAKYKRCYLCYLCYHDFLSNYVYRSSHATSTQEPRRAPPPSTDEINKNCIKPYCPPFFTGEATSTVFAEWPKKQPGR